MAVRIFNANGGPRKMWGTRDADGHRIWYAIWRVSVGDTVAEFTSNGPATALQCPGLPIPGSLWILRNEVDVYAWCRSDNTVNPVQPKEGDPAQFYDVQFTFSTKPPTPDRAKRNQPEGTKPEKKDPLAEQDKISGSFVKYTEQAALDRFGVPIVNTAFEPFIGPQVEFDATRPQIRIEQNVADLQLATLAKMCNTVNDRTMWGFPKRTIKLGVPSWTQNYHGNGTVYFTRTLEFDIYQLTDATTGELVSGYDRDLLDEGTKVLHGHYDGTGTWILDNIGGSPPDPGNPDHYDRFKDKNGENARVVFDNTGSGKPLSDTLSGQVTAVTPGAPVVITAPAHNLISGDVVVVRGLTGANKADVNNTQWVVAVLTSATFSLVTSTALALGVDTTTRWFKINTKAGKVHVEKYEESNFFLLGLPLIP